jgi:hypothetical protein
MENKMTTNVPSLWPWTMLPNTTFTVDTLLETIPPNGGTPNFGQAFTDCFSNENCSAILLNTQTNAIQLISSREPSYASANTSAIVLAANRNTVCNTPSLFAPYSTYCSQRCVNNEGLCDNFMIPYCKVVPSDPACSCINSTIQNPNCSQFNCIHGGYKTLAMQQYLCPKTINSMSAQNCVQTPGQCDAYMTSYCTNSNSDPSCSCINSTISNPTVNDTNCINSGYQTYAMINPTNWTLIGVVIIVVIIFGFLIYLLMK